MRELVWMFEGSLSGMLGRVFKGKKGTPGRDNLLDNPDRLVDLVKNLRRQNK